MKIIRQDKMLEGERALAIEPAPAIRIRTCWNRRLHFYSGRTLTRTDLNLEQSHRANHLALGARKLSHGVVDGLELWIEPGPTDAPPAEDATDTRPRLRVAVNAGVGITAQGEEIRLDRTLNADLDLIPVDGRPTGDTTPPAGLGVILLQPILADDAAMVADGYPCDLDRSDNAFKDTCERDPADDAFENWRIMDGCRLVWFPWPSSWALPLPPYGSRLRDLVRNIIFEREAALAGHILPWEACGLPLALVHRDSAGELDFIDRFAVVRQGGAPVQPRALVDEGGNPFIWQARIQAFADHMAALREEGLTLQEALQHFRFLPPVGVVPRDFIDLEQARVDFLPDSYRVEAAPIPVEQFGLAVEAAASMEPFDLLAPDRLKVLIPVPQNLFEPDLLKKEKPDPIFAETITALFTTLNTELGKRQILREMVKVVRQTLDIDDKPEYAAEPDALADEAPDENAVVEEVCAKEALDEMVALHTRLETAGILADAELNEIDPQVLADAPPREHDFPEDFTGLTPFMTALKEKADRSDDTINLGFLRLQTDMYRFRQMMLGNTKASRLATSPALADIAQGTTNTATEANINAYFQRLEDVKYVDGVTGYGSASGGGVRGSGTVEPKAAPQASTVEPKDFGVLLGTRPVAEGVHRMAIPDSVTGIGKLGTAADTPSATMRMAEIAPVTEMVMATGIDITGQAPIVGEALEFRTANVAERLTAPPGPEAKSYAVATKAQVLGNLATLPINIENLEVSIAGGDGAVLTETAYNTWYNDQGFNDAEKEVLAKRASLSGGEVFVYLGRLSQGEKDDLGERQNHFRAALDKLFLRNKVFLQADNLGAHILAGRYDPDPRDGDEASFLAVGVTAIENTIGALRKVEGIVAGYRKAHECCTQTATKLVAIRKKNQAALVAVDQSIAELRHDLAIALSLYDEEKVRVAKINTRRKNIRDHHVPFVAFIRPRTVSTRRSAPVGQLHGEFKDPIPVCSRTDLPIPDALDECVDLFRDVPLKWLPGLKILLQELDRPDRIKFVYGKAIQKAQLQIATQPAGLLTAETPKASPGFALAAENIITANRQFGYAMVQQRAQLNLQVLETLSWSQLRKRAADELTLSDLLDSGRGRTALAQKAVANMEAIENIAGCFWARCKKVEPAIRWRWADRISVFDTPMRLQRLNVLPGWSDLDFDLARTLQRFVGWLFQQVDNSIPAAVALMNDLVRVAILLASHAPVESIISGHVPAPVKGRVGDVVRLPVDTGKASVGMQVAVYGAEGPAIAVQGVVQDILADLAEVRITQAVETTFEIVGGAKVSFMPKRR